jgi:hypothetical protein
MYDRTCNCGATIQAKTEKQIEAAMQIHNENAHGQKKNKKDKKGKDKDKEKEEDKD